MPEVLLFGEDYGHEAVVKAVIEKVAADLNLPLCVKVRSVGRRTREEQLMPILKPLNDLPPTVLAIPDPHIERWLLIDSHAFKAVLGRGCKAPVTKCQRGLYKDLLARAVSDTGVRPLIGGIEHAEEIVKAMDIPRIRQVEESFGRLIGDLERALMAWQK